MTKTSKPSRIVSLRPTAKRAFQRAAAAAIGSALLVLLVAVPSDAAVAKLKPISGKLSARGYTVIAIAANGSTTSVRSANGRFRLRPPAKVSTLHLRAPDGKYAGPVVLGSRNKGTRAYVGVLAGAKLGDIRYLSKGKYAKTKRFSLRAQGRMIALNFLARAKRGIPIGAGKLGLVAAAPTSKAPPGDFDFDGIPNPLDVDDDGDLIADGFDSKTSVRASALAGGLPAGGNLNIATGLLTFDFAPIGPVNANDGSSDQQIAASQALYGTLNIGSMGIDAGSGELDCGKLIYCSAGGTGVLQSPTSPIFRSAGSPYPSCCDADADGLGSLGGAPSGGAMVLFHGASSDQIGAGDVIILKATANGVPIQSAKTVGFVFSTPPTLAEYGDGQGNSAKFPNPQPTPKPSSPIKAAPSGDTIVSFKLWRPQRQRLTSEAGTTKWMDMGKLLYMASVFVSDTKGNTCPQSSLSTSDPDLQPTLTTPYGPFPNAGGFSDLSPDRPPDSANTLDFTLNISDCLAAKGQTFDPGDVARVNFHAFSYGEDSHLADARSDFPFKRVP